MKLCNVEGCGLQHYSKGMCSRHYNRARFEDPEYRERINARKRRRYAEDPAYRALCISRSVENHAFHREKTTRRQSEWLGRQRGFTQALAYALWEHQRGRCAICEVSLQPGKRVSPTRVARDHDHATGTARGLLCHVCNLALGWYESHQRPAGLRLAQYEAYLTDPPARMFDSDGRLTVARVSV